MPIFRNRRNRQPDLVRWDYPHARSMAPAVLRIAEIFRDNARVLGERFMPNPSLTLDPSFAQTSQGLCLARTYWPFHFPSEVREIVSIDVYTPLGLVHIGGAFTDEVLWGDFEELVALGDDVPAGSQYRVPPGAPHIYAVVIVDGIPDKLPDPKPRMYHEFVSRVETVEAWTAIRREVARAKKLTLGQSLTV